MKGITGYLLGAVALALVGGACLKIGLLERDIARAEQNIAAMNYDGAEATYQTAERYFEYASHLPGIGNARLNDVRARRAALHYWQQDYGMIVPKQTDPIAALPADNLELQFVVANAVFRSGLAQAKDRQTALRALDTSINAYLSMLKNAKQHDDAAYNCEYVVRLREEFDKGRRKPGGSGAEQKILYGTLGFPMRDTQLPNLKLYIPLDPGERKQLGLAGKAVPRPRKG